MIVDEVVTLGVPRQILDEQSTKVGIIHGTKDDISNIEVSEQLGEIIPKAKLIKIQDANHSFDGHMEEVLNLTIGALADNS